MTNAPRPTVFVVDDDASWRKSLGRVLLASDYSVAMYKSALEFLDHGDLHAAGCILLDVRMPGLSGLQLQARLTAADSALPIVFLTGHGDISMSVQAMKAGAEDFLPKPVRTEVLLEAVARAIAQNRTVREDRQERALHRALVAALTPTEHKIFLYLLTGKLNKQIAAELAIVERTVKWHRHNVMQKLQVGSIAELVLLSQRL